MKKTMMHALIIPLMVGFLFLAAPPPAAAKVSFLTIGTGDVNGVYYPTGGAMAKILNKMKDQYCIRAVVETTGGSVDNVNAVMAGDMQVGIVQSDRQYQAVNGLAEWADKPQKNLRSILSLYPEAVTLLASNTSGIQTLAEVKGKKVNIGIPDSGPYQNALDALSLVRLNDPKEWLTEEIKPGSASSLLKNGTLDAFFVTVGHPCDIIKQITEQDPEVHFVPIAPTDDFLEQHPYYTRTEILSEDYPQIATPKNVPTFGAKATLITSADVPDDLVYALTKVIFENFDEFKQSHPALARLTKKGMLEGLTAPIHPGALKYYQESGLDKNLGE